MTERIFHQDAYCREFSATVESVRKNGGKRLVSLNRTAFYPEGGGQPADRGQLNGSFVLDVVEEEGKVVHIVSSSDLRLGEEVRGRLDWTRRFDHMQQHTGQHILSRSFLSTLKAETESFHLGTEVSTIDLSVDRLTAEEIYRTEDLANRIVFEDRSVSAGFPPPDELARIPLRRPPPVKSGVRVVEIEDFDWSACGGTHCRRSGEVGLIKVRRWERVRGRARVEFLCGYRTLADYRWKNRAVFRIARLLSAQDRQVVEAVEQLNEQRMESLRRSRELEENLLSLRALQLTREGVEVGDVRLVRAVLPAEEAGGAVQLASRIVEKSERTVVLFGVRDEKARLVFARSRDLDLDLREWISASADVIEGRGGGGESLAQAGGGKPEALEEALDLATRRLRSYGLAQE